MIRAIATSEGCPTHRADIFQQETSQQRNGSKHYENGNVVGGWNRVVRRETGSSWSQGTNHKTGAVNGMSQHNDNDGSRRHYGISSALGSKIQNDRVDRDETGCFEMQHLEQPVSCKSYSKIPENPPVSVSAPSGSTAPRNISTIVKSFRGKSHDEIRRISNDVGSSEAVVNRELQKKLLAGDESRKANGSESKEEANRMKKYLDRIQKIRFEIGAFLEDPSMQMFIVCMITLNAMVMGIGTFPFVKDNPSINDTFDTIDQIFLILFTIELVLHMIHHGFRLLLNGWLVFDLVIITISWSLSKVQYGQAFRIFRALRLVTHIDAMRDLVVALFAVMPRVLCICGLLTLVSYIFAVMYTQLWKDFHHRGLTDDNYFGSLDVTFLTLFQMSTLDNWSSIARQVMAVDWWAWFPICSYLVITGFIVVHLLVAVICDAVANLHAEETAKLNGTDENDDNNSANPGVPDIRTQLHALEVSVQELTMMQEETLETLAMLTRQMKWSREQQRKKDVSRLAAETAKSRKRR